MATNPLPNEVKTGIEKSGVQIIAKAVNHRANILLCCRVIDPVIVRISSL